LHQNIYIEQHQAHLRKRSLENDNIELADYNESYNTQIREYDLVHCLVQHNKFLVTCMRKYISHPSMEMLLYREMN
jgi:hypothetical protein